MKVSAWVEAEVDVEVSISTLMASIAELADSDQVRTTLDCITAVWQVLKSIPADRIAAMTQDYRVRIGYALRVQAERYSESTGGFTQTAKADDVLTQVGFEMARAQQKYPTWPTDPLHALAVLGEEFGELNKSMLQLTYEPHKTSAEEVRTEAIQTAAMALRLVLSLDRYVYAPCNQHNLQGPIE